MMNVEIMLPLSYPTKPFLTKLKIYLQLLTQSQNIFISFIYPKHLFHCQCVCFDKRIGIPFRRKKYLILNHILILHVNKLKFFRTNISLVNKEIK